MAQLNNLLVNGNSRFVGDALHTGAVDVSVLRVPSASGATVRTVGINGQVLKSNGTSVYWGSDSNSDTKVTQTATTTSANYEVLFSQTADNTTRTEEARKSSRLVYNPSTGVILNIGGLELKGHIAGDSSSTGHGLSGGGGYHNAYNNIILHGDNSTGSSGIAFISDKVDSAGTVTNINQPSDRAFIQYHANGITSASAELTNPTLATSGENGRLVIGLGNDATDQLWLQTPGRTGLIHQVGTASYVIPDTANTNGNVGGTTQPVYVSGGVISPTTYSLAKSVPSDAIFTDHTYTPATSVTDVDTTGAVGTSTNYARQDHAHKISLATGDSNGQVKIAGSNVSVKGLGSAAYKDITDTYSSTSTDAVSGKAVAEALESLPKPMVFQGSLGTGGTITSLPTDGTARIGDTYKVITAGTYAGISAKVGDTFICDSRTSTSNTWILIPSGDEPSGTVTSIKIEATSPINVDSSSPITTSGTRTISHATSGVTSGTYGTIATTALEPGYGGTFNVPAFTVDAMGHITSAGNHTVKIPASDNTNYYHTTGTWSALTYTASKVGSPGDLAFTIPTGTTASTVAIGNHTHSYAGSSAAGGSANSAVKLDSNAGSATNPVYFSGGKPVSCTYSLNKTVPSDAVFTDTNYYHKTGSWSGLTYTAGKVGSPDDLAFTIPTGTTASTVAVGNHTHTTTIATSSGTNQITLAHNTKYAITAGGTSYVFTTPSDTNTDTKVSQTVTTTANWRKVVVGYQSDSTYGAAVTAQTNETYVSNKLEYQPSTGTLRGSVIQANRVDANISNSGNSGGLSLYSTDPAAYGVTMRNTGTSSGQLGKHGYVQGDWASYFTFSGDRNRGWIFREANTNVASIDGNGNGAFSGNLTVGANTTNTSGCRMEFNANTLSLDFSFA